MFLFQCFYFHFIFIQHCWWMFGYDLFSFGLYCMYVLSGTYTHLLFCVFL